MKEVETTPTKSKPESPSLSQEFCNSNDKKKNDNSDPVAKTSLPAKAKAKENGVRVSSVNGSSSTGDLDGGGVDVGSQQDSVEKKDLGVQEDSVLMGANDEDDGLEDSEINGASSLLQMQEGSKSLHGLGSVLDVIDQNENMGLDVLGINTTRSDFKQKRRQVGRNLRSKSVWGNEEYSDGKIIGEWSNINNNDGEVEESGDEGHDFSIGDFVWGKVRSHPWWPGRIYDPADASDFAKKVKQRRDKILVAYFGDGTFAWCNPSQLKPLDENFVEMSKQSNSKNFVNATEKALDEVGRLVDLKMTCSCVPKENLIGFGRTLAVNAGIKEGLLIPEGGIDKLSPAFFEPAEFLASLKGAAQVCTATNILEIIVLRSWLSAFYRAKGGYQLPYYDPKPIPGLEDDDSRNWVVDLSNYSSGVEVRIQGPVEEDWLSSPRKHDQTSENMLRKCQGVPGDGPHQRRKQKSLAEILEGQTDAEVENNDIDGVLAEEGTTSSKSTSSAKRYKRKCMGENTGADCEDKVVDATEGASLEKSASSSGRKKRKVSDEAVTQGKNKLEAVTKAVENSGKPQRSSGRKKRKSTDEAHLDADASGVNKKSVKTTESRGRKKTVSSNAEDDGSHGGKDEEEIRGNIMSAEKVNGSPSNNDEADVQIKKGSLLRERKRSKYLSPPYTNINKGQRKKNEVEADSSEAQLAERLTKAAGNLMGSSPILKSGGEKSQKKMPGAVRETSDGSGPQTPKQGQSIVIDPVIVKVPANEVLSKMRSAALNPLYLKETNSVDVVGEFVSAFRVSSCCDMIDSEYSKLFSERKRKSQKSEPGSLVKDQNQTDQSSPDQKSQRRTKTKKNEEVKADDKPKVKKQAASAPEDMKTKDKEPKGKAPGAALYVSFGPLSTLPTKNDLIQIYGKYGALNENETDMLYTNYCARVVFLKTSEAEEAFNDSQLSSPFKSANVTFQLRYLSAETKTRELSDLPSNKRSSLAKKGAKATGVPAASQSSASNVSELNFVKQKLEMVASLLETSAGKISPDTKSILEGEVKVLLEKVSSMVGSSS